MRKEVSPSTNLREALAKSYLHLCNKDIAWKRVISRDAAAADM